MTTNWRGKLLALKEELLANSKAGASSSAVVELDQTKVGRLSRMDALQAQAMAKAAEQRRDSMLLKIDAALQRIERGDYGLCLACDEAINPKRLEVDPTATLCIDCANKL